jgi:hypothetical protein
MEKILITLFLFSGISYSQASEWKVVETDACDEKIVIKGKEGEPFVTVLKGAKEIKLFGKNGAVFHEEGLSQTEFVSSPQRAEYTFIYPGYVDGNPPKIDVVEDLKTKRCRLELTR